ncbi:MAG: sugar ABC transporter ATP-binding protein [Clostridiales Family XIII bacterium]|jgi:ABC-type sugar transport system ATPase subunit|nr:sugar ABC transporter ATP-binding protein [Clostridiales Family XIII bacterium]
MLLEVNKLKKNFGAVSALKDASFKLKRGEIRALLGAHGSGKSTLVKILSGLNKCDGGVIRIDDKDIKISSPTASLRHGVAMSYQDLSLIPILSVCENMALGNEPTARAMGPVDKKRMLAYAERMIDELGIGALPDTTVGRISLSDRGLVEVAKALYTGPRILVLDEITASMHHDQVSRLFDFLENKAAEGLSVIFVSHRFDEVYKLCRTATILREGVSVKDIDDLKTVSSEELVYYMTGHRLETHDIKPSRPNKVEQDILTVRDLHVGNAVNGVSLRVERGEIVGIAGLQGQGQGEFLRALYGAIPYSGGSVELDGERVRVKSPGAAIRKGFGFISGDREKEGVFSIRSVTENIFSVRYAMSKLIHYIDAGKERKEMDEIVSTLNIVTAGYGTPANRLSGGNQQKLVLGRWLCMKPRVLLLDDPTKGVDVGARTEINNILRELTRTGVSILFSSSDNEELLRIAGRICVFYEGKILCELEGDRLKGDVLAASMLGVRQGAQ